MKRNVFADIRRLLAWVLCFALISGITHVPTMTVRAETEGDSVTVTEAEETKESAPNVTLDTAEPLNTGSEEEEFVPEIEYIDTIETSAIAWSIFGMRDTGKPDLISGNAVEWINRLDTSGDHAFIKDFYNDLIEASDGDGVDDFLIDDSYYVDNEGNPKNLYMEATVTVPLTLEDGGNPADEAAAWNRINELDHTYYQNCIVAAEHAFDRDHTEVFWLSGTNAYATVGGNPVGDAVNGWTYDVTVYYYIQHVDGNGEVDFSLRAEKYNSRSAIETAIEAIDENADTILTGADGKSDYEKIRYFNEWLTENNAYNSSADLNSIGHDCREVTSALAGLAGTTGPVCEAYARAFKLLCDRSGIDCVLVDGNPLNDDGSEMGGHMWNYVKLEGNWYAVDVTWNDPMVGGKEEEKISGFENEDWLLLGSETTVYDNGMAYLTSHPVENCLSDNGVQFINGPELSETAYEPEAENLVYSLMVDDVSVTASDDGRIITSSGTVAHAGAWSYEDGVLTLENIVPSVGISWAEGDLSIRLVGDILGITITGPLSDGESLTILGSNNVFVASFSCVDTITVKNCILELVSLEGNTEATFTDTLVWEQGKVTNTVYGTVTLPEDFRSLGANEKLYFTEGSSIANLEKLSVDADTKIYVEGVEHEHTLTTSYTTKGNGVKKHTKTAACEDCPAGYKVVMGEEDCTLSEATCISDEACSLCNTVYNEADESLHSMDPATGYCEHECGTLLAVAKVDDTYHDDFATALTNWTDGSTLTLVTNISDYDRSLEVTDGTKTLDLNGKTFTSTAWTIVSVGGTAELTIQDSGTNGKMSGSGDGGSEAVVYVAENATLRLNGGEFIGECALKNAGTSYVGENVKIDAEEIGIYLDDGTVYFNELSEFGAVPYFYYAGGIVEFMETPQYNYTIECEETGCFAKPHSAEVSLPVDHFNYTNPYLNYVVNARADGLYLSYSIASATITLENTAVTYTGAALEPAVETVILKSGAVLTEGTDYSVTYSNNVAVGKGTVTVTGINDYTGTVSTTFTINKGVLQVVSAVAEDREYDGTTKVSVTDVTLSGIAPGDDVAVNVTNLTGTLGGANAASYTQVTLPTLTLTGANAANYTLTQPTGVVTCNVTISPKTVTTPTFAGLAAQYATTGNAVEPTFTLTIGIL